MPQIYDISILKKVLEDITGQEVYLKEKESLPTKDSSIIDIDNNTLEILMRNAFNNTLQHLAIKNVFKHILKQYIRNKYNIKDGRILDNFMISKSKQIDQYYHRLTIEKELLQEDVTTANIATGVQKNNNSKDMVVRSMKDNYQYTVLIEKLEKLTNKKVKLIQEENNTILSLDQLKSIQSKIKKEDLYEEEPGFGLEKDPHSTVAYVKAGEGKKYVDMFKNKTYTITPKNIVYSKPDGKQEERNILTESKKKKSKYLNVKNQISHMKIPAELKAEILKLVNSGTRVSEKRPVIHGLTKPTDFNKRVKEHNLPTGYELGADKNGFFVATHRARCHSYESPVKIPIRAIKFIDSTG